MARVDDYREAKKIAVQRLQKESLDDLVERSGFERIQGRKLCVPFLDRVYSIDFPDCEMAVEQGKTGDIPLQEQVLILHYLIGVTPRPLSGNWIPYREVPGASFYHAVFIKRAIDPLKKILGPTPSLFAEASRRLNGQRVAYGDVSFAFRIFPKVPIQIILWEGDEEFPAEANILFDRTISDMFSPEDVAWIASLLVYRLIALSKQL